MTIDDIKTKFYLILKIVFSSCVLAIKNVKLKSVVSTVIWNIEKTPL